MVSLVIAALLTAILLFIIKKFSKRQITPDGKIILFVAYWFGAGVIVISRLAEIYSTAVGIVVLLATSFIGFSLRQPWFAFEKSRGKAGKSNIKTIRIKKEKVENYFPELVKWLSDQGLTILRVGTGQDLGPLYIGRREFKSGVLEKVILGLIVALITGIYAFITLNAFKLSEFALPGGLGAALAMGILTALLLTSLGRTLGWSLQLELDGGNLPDGSALYVRIFGDSKNYMYDLSSFTLSGGLLYLSGSRLVDDFFSYMQNRLSVTVFEGKQRVGKLESPTIEISMMSLTADLPSRVAPPSPSSEPTETNGVAIKTAAAAAKPNAPQSTPDIIDFNPEDDFGGGISEPSFSERPIPKASDAPAIFDEFHKDEAIDPFKPAADGQEKEKPSQEPYVERSKTISAEQGLFDDFNSLEDVEKAWEQMEAARSAPALTHIEKPAVDTPAAEPEGDQTIRIRPSEAQKKQAPQPNAAIPSDMGVDTPQEIQKPEISLPPEETGGDVTMRWTPAETRAKMAETSQKDTLPHRQPKPSEVIKPAVQTPPEERGGDLTTRIQTAEVKSRAAAPESSSEPEPAWEDKTLRGPRATQRLSPEEVQKVMRSGGMGADAPEAAMKTKTTAMEIDAQFDRLREDQPVKATIAPPEKKVEITTAEELGRATVRFNAADLSPDAGMNKTMKYAPAAPRQRAGEDSFSLNDLAPSPAPPVKTTPARQPTPAAETKLVKCPNCGLEQDDADKCLLCDAKLH